MIEWYGWDECREKKNKEFESKTEADEFLVLADLRKDQVDEIKYRVKQHLPQIIVKVIELEITAYS
jgi:hypothetical protein